MKPTPTPLLVAAGIFGLGALLSLAGYVALDRTEQQRIATETRQQVQTQLEALQTATSRYEERLDSLRTLFEFSATADRSEFHGVAGKLLARFPAMQAVEWAPLVPGAGRTAVEAVGRAEGFPDFTFRDRVSAVPLRHDVARPADEYVPVLYIEPLAPNLPALGFNLLSGSSAAELARARATGQVMMSPRLQLLTPQRNLPGFVLYLPVFAGMSPPGGASRPDFRGVVIGVFRLDHLLREAKSLPSTGNLFDLLIIDRTGPDQPDILGLVGRDQAVQLDVPVIPAPFTASECVHAPFRIWGRTWELVYRPSPDWIRTQQTREPARILALGLLASAALALLIYGRARRTALIEQTVTVRTDELRRTQQLLEEDIRRRTAVEQALKVSEARLQAILDHSPNSIFVKDLASRYLLVNRRHAQLWNRPATEFIGHDDRALFPPEIAAGFHESDQRMLSAGTAISYEVTVPLPGGESTAIVQKFPLRDAEGRVYGLGGISTDITGRKQAEAELQENRRQLSNLISQLPGAAFRCQFDEKLTALFASEGMLALTGYPAEDYLAGRVHIAQLTVPADRPAVRAAVGAAIKERRPFEVEYRLTHRGGQERWVLVRGRPIYEAAGTLRFLEGLAIDVTALKLAEQEKISIERKLLAAQKLESLGVLAGGIAHDFNNILTSVLANASLARHDAKAGQPVDRSLEQIENAARRAADLCQQMLAYAGKGRIVTDRVNLSELVRGTAALLEVTLSKNTRLDLRLAGDLPPVLADLTQLRQIVMNLVINSSDAITGPAGLITITTFAREMDAALLRSALGSPDLPPGNYAGLEVTDNGSGMAPETIARIFEPFFTTKFSGRGLGLSAVLGIVQSHRGALFVESQLGRGSTFRLLLPATAGPAVSTAPPFPAPAGPVALRGTVLVVDDEEAVRSIAAAVLEIHGAVSLTVASGEAALDLLRTHGKKIALVLLDLTMPGLSGEETLRRMRMRDARQPVILMSGYSETEIMQRSAHLGVAGFIQKPFEVETLLAKTRPFLS